MVIGSAQPGDDRGPVTSNDMLIGPAYGGHVLAADWNHPEIDDTTRVKFSAILNDVNAKGGPGAGLTPIPA